MTAARAFKAIQITLILVFILPLFGCTPTVGKGQAIGFDPQKTSLRYQISKRLAPGITAATVEPAALADTVAERSRIINAMQTGYSGPSTGTFTCYLDQKTQAQSRLAHRSNGYAGFQLGLSGAGILTGIASAGLIVASPANAAAAAICAAFTTGILGFQTNAVTQGFSRTASDRATIQFNEDLVAAEIQFEERFGDLQAVGLDTQDDNAWNTAAGKAITAWMKLQRTVINDPPLVPEAGDIARLKQQLEDVRSISTMQIPAAAGNLTATAVAGPPVKVSLTWINPATNATKVNIGRSLNNQQWDVIASVAGDAVSHNDTPNLATGTILYYRVTIANPAGESAPTATGAVTLP